MFKEMTARDARLLSGALAEINGAYYSHLDKVRGADFIAQLWPMLDTAEEWQFDQDVIFVRLKLTPDARQAVRAELKRRYDKQEREDRKQIAAREKELRRDPKLYAQVKAARAKMEAKAIRRLPSPPCEERRGRA